MKPVQLVTRFHGLVLLVLVAVTITAFVKIPSGSMLPVHWGLHGQPDWLWPRDLALLMMPALAVLITATFWLLGRFAAPEHVEPGRHISEAALTGLLGLFAAIQFGLLLIGIGSDVDMIRIIAFAMAVLLLILGNELPRSSPNTYAGLRLPWTMRDPANWKVSHRVAGVLFMICGLALAAAAWLQPDPATLIILLVAALLMPVVFGALFSWAISRRSAAR